VKGLEVAGLFFENEADLAVVRRRLAAGSRRSVGGGLRIMCVRPMPLSSGVRLGPFEVLSSLGAGSMGEVCRARDVRLDRIVAIKVLHARVATEPALADRFEREARIIAALNHPHICTLFDVGVQEGVPYLVMEYLEGQTFANRCSMERFRPKR
jgi:serine/threonine protein kinase